MEEHVLLTTYPQDRRPDRDQAHCSCGWQSTPYWATRDISESKWLEHARSKNPEGPLFESPPSTRTCRASARLTQLQPEEDASHKQGVDDWLGSGRR
jgi:hypothetical protein